mmetsp:Transcript_31584/g.102011  ORF Transcript_31584/g.102011 Transcript_31584/m.102011 type:complete len:217 (+) Transcript_31584:761-1411(+)
MRSRTGRGPWAWPWACAAPPSRTSPPRRSSHPRPPGDGPPARAPPPASWQPHGRPCAPAARAAHQGRSRTTSRPRSRSPRPNPTPTHPTPRAQTGRAPPPARPCAAGAAAAWVHRCQTRSTRAPCRPAWPRRRRSPPCCAGASPGPSREPGSPPPWALRLRACRRGASCSRCRRSCQHSPPCPWGWPRPDSWRQSASSSRPVRQSSRPPLHPPTRR